VALFAGSQLRDAVGVRDALAASLVQSQSKVTVIPHKQSPTGYHIAGGGSVAAGPVCGGNRRRLMPCTPSVRCALRNRSQLCVGTPGELTDIAVLYRRRWLGGIAGGDHSRSAALGAGALN
jgi:hypothetical protein